MADEKLGYAPCGHIGIYVFRNMVVCAMGCDDEPRRKRADTEPMNTCPGKCAELYEMDGHLWCQDCGRKVDTI